MRLGRLRPGLCASVLAFFTCLSLASSSWAAPGPAQVLEQAAMEALAAVQVAGNEPVHPFTTDGCSGGLSAAWQGAARLFPGLGAVLGETPPWEECCVTHDRAYWRGETTDGYAGRLAADVELRRCVAATGVEKKAEVSARLGVAEERVVEFFDVTGELMYAAVRTGGGPCTGLPWRWGYGWPHCLPRAGSRSP